MNKKILLSLFVVFSAFGIRAQEEKKEPGSLVTDRPDATESASVVPKGFLQIETGAFYEELETNGFKVKNKVYNTTLLRYGLFDNLEFRLGWDISAVKTEAANLNGMSPLLFGAKIAIIEEKGILPEIGLIGHVRWPFSASADFRAETTGVDFRFAFAHTLSEKSSLSYNLGAAWGDDSPEAVYEYTLAYGYSFTENFGGYMELYGDFPEDSRASHLWDAGLTYLFSDNIQVDASVGSGLNKTQDLYLSAGISIRVPR